MNRGILTLFLGLGLLFAACDPARRSSSPSGPNPPKKPTPGKPAPIDTIRWTPGNTGKPPIGNTPGKPGNRPDKPALGDTYHIAYLLPFLSNQMTPGGTVPEKSQLAVQFYTGAKIALEQLSTEAQINLVVDVWDTQANDADFQKLMANPRLEKSSVFIGPVRTSHVQAFAEWTKARGKILISPESPTLHLTAHNPDFIQTNPSLQSHCEAIIQYVRPKYRAEDIVLICKEKEVERLTYFQNGNSAYGSTRLAELVMPDASTNFDKADLKKYLRAGRTTVFILPTWSSQDFVMAFLRKLKDSKGTNRVEVYGMPQWRNFEAIDPEYLSSLNVHISASSYIDFTVQELKDFQQKFYEASGTIPDDDGFNGYDVTLFCGRMLARYGLSFPERLKGQTFQGLRAPMQFAPMIASGNLDDAKNEIDYLENKAVRILKFDKFGFVPAE